MVTLGALLSALSLASPAQATWTVSGGGAKTMAPTQNAQLHDTTTGVDVICTSHGYSFTVPNGSGFSGTNIGSLTAQPSRACTVGGLPLTVDSLLLPWAMSATSYSPGNTSGTLSGVHFHIYGAGCSFSLNGTIPWNYHNSSKIISHAGGSMTVTAASCFGLVNTGDSFGYFSQGTVTPGALVITNP
jgi:hypothetical protein